MRNIRRLIFILIACVIFSDASGQFYNGHQMTFGKNRVQYYDYYWMFYRFDDFDCYFNEYGRELAQFTADYAIERLEEIEDFFDYTLEKRLIFVIYNKNAEYKQTNIGLLTSDEDNYNTGGYSRIIENKVMLYYEGDHVAYKKQIAAEKAANAQLQEEKKKAAKNEQALKVGEAFMDFASGSIKIWSKYMWSNPIIGGILQGLLAAMFGLNLATINKQKFAEGGSFVLEGPGHDQGGIQLSPGKEAEGGEMIGILSREKTKKHGGLFEGITDIFNKDKISELPDFLFHKGLLRNIAPPVFVNNNDYSKLETEMKGMRKDLNKQYNAYLKGIASVITDSKGRVIKITKNDGSIETFA